MQVHNIKTPTLLSPFLGIFLSMQGTHKLSAVIFTVLNGFQEHLPVMEQLGRWLPLQLAPAQIHALS